MPSVSKIPQNINKYAIKCAKKICNEKLEIAKGIDINFDKTIRSESDYISGRVDGNDYEIRFNPKDVFVHNHPGGTELSYDDISTAIKNDVKKIFASTGQGYTSIDFTTVKKSVSKNDMYTWLFYAQSAAKKFIDELAPKPNDDMMTMFKKCLQRNEYFNNKLKEFAKLTGATFSDVKWSDYKTAKNNK